MLGNFIGGGIGFYLITLIFRYFAIGRGGSKRQHIGMVWFIALWMVFSSISASTNNIIPALSAVFSAPIITIFLSWRYMPDETAPQRTAKQIILRTIFMLVGIFLATLLLIFLLKPL